MFRNRSVDVHQFAMVPRSDVPRSRFRKQNTHKTTFDEDYLIPVFCDEVLPGDTFSLKMTAFARLATPIYPLMDNLYLDSFFFFVPNRLVWANWRKFMGEQTNPADSISYTIPQISLVASGAPGVGTIYDYFGLPTFSDIGVSTISFSALPLRCYNLIYNEWFRDENLINSAVFGNTATPYDFGDGPDPLTNYALRRRGKRHDYFTSALPWTQKGGVAVTLPLGTSAPIKTSATDQISGAQGHGIRWMNLAGTVQASNGTLGVLSNSGSYESAYATVGGTPSGPVIVPSNLYADLSAATAATVNQLRQSFQIQKLLERDARGGTRYTELIRAHFGVISPDARLQRPEYLGGGSVPINIAPIAQTSGTGASGTTAPLGNLGAFGTMVAQGHGFTQSFTEHGHIIGLVNVRADLTYQRGLRRMWSRQTRYDFYWPEFAMLGEQAILNQEIWCQGVPGTGANQDQGVFGYQERWAEYRYMPSLITGQFRSTFATPLDAWHLSQKFTALPTLGQTFIESNTPISRVVAVNTPGSHFIFDGFFDVSCTRPMPMYSVPGMIDHF